MSVNPYSEFLREPNLLIPQKRPIGQIKINRTHPLARNLMLCCVPNRVNRGVDLISGKVPSLDGQAFVSDRGFETPDTGFDDHIIFDNLALNNHATQFTVITGFVNTGAAFNYETCLWHCDTGGDEHCVSSTSSAPNSLYIRHRTNIARNGVSTGIPFWNDGEQHVFAMQITHRTDNGAEIDVWIDGETVMSTGAIFTWDANTVISKLAIRSNSSGAANSSPVGFTEFFYIFDRQMSDEELRNFMRNPYQIVVPA